MKDSLLQTCADIIGAENVDSAFDPPVLSPSSAESCAELFRHLHVEKHPVAIRGGGTYPVPTPGDKLVVVSTSSMSEIRDVDESDFVIDADAGTTLNNAVETAEVAGLTFPVDRLYGNTMTLGGLFMSGRFNPGISDSMPFIRKVIGVKGVVANGDIVTFGGRTRKNVTGYEVTRFLAGSMGLYMLATELTIAVRTTPERRTVLSAVFPTGADIMKAVQDILNNMDIEPYMLDVVAPDGFGHPCGLMIGYKGNRTTVEKHISKANEILERNSAKTVTRIHADEALKIRRENDKNFAFTGMVSYNLPRSAVKVFLEKISSKAPSLPIRVYPLDGIVHTASGSDLFENKTFTDTVRSVGGKIPVIWDEIRQGGIAGLIDIPERAIMQSLKHELDPAGMLNPHIGLQE